MIETDKHRLLRDILENLYQKYNRRVLIAPDPLQFVYKYDRPQDMEMAGLLSALMATGRVGQIEKSLTKLFTLTGQSPYQFAIDSADKQRRHLAGFVHRFTTGEDIADLLILLKYAIKKSGSLENYFLSGLKESDENIIPALTHFCDSLLGLHASKHGGKISRGIKYLLTSPSGGSCCKRINLFLRWMVRSDDVDAGLWKSVDKAKLVVPIDVHISRLCRIIGFHNDKTTSIRTAVKVTEKFAEIIPQDPVKYDFALSRIGIIENCTGKHRPQCRTCELLGFCQKGKFSISRNLRKNIIPS
jgi:uncharacterized protein (TIGR02757 family)